MKTKRKIRLSGYWWFPIRKFEFSTSHDLDDVLDSILKLRETHQINASINRRKNPDGRYPFLLRHNVVGRNYGVITGNVEFINNTILISGESRLENLTMWFVVFSTHFLFVGFIVIFHTLESISLGFANTIIYCALSPFFLCFPVGFLWFYFRAIRKLNTAFEALIQAIQGEKAKLKNNELLEVK